MSNALFYNQFQPVCFDKCTACGSCIQICPKKCISYKKNDYGTTIALKNMEDCCACNLCEQACPQLNDSPWNYPLESYAAWSMDKNIRETSASGGIATELYRYCSGNGYYYSGVKMNDNLLPEYGLYSSEKEFLAFQNSKYVHSDTKTVYFEIGELLKRDKKVLFIGIPCQVAGLQQYIKTKKISDNNLIVVDIVCHGTTETHILQEHISFIEKKYNNTTTGVFFRDPEEGTHTFTFSLKNGEKTYYKKKVHRNDAYQVGYHYGITYRENCYKCKYARRERVGDLTISDYSGLGKAASCDYGPRNVSCILVNTLKGKQIFLAIKDVLIHVDKRPLSEELEHEKQLNHPTIESEMRKVYLAEMKKTGDFEAAMNVAAKKQFVINEMRYYLRIEQIKRIASKIVPARIKKMLRKIL